MFEDMKKIFRTVVTLAEERNYYYNKSKSKEGDVIDLFKEPPNNDVDYQKYITKQKQLEEYLNSLNFEQIKILQTIMYLGRDKDYNSDDTPEQIYKNQREYMDDLGWKEKWIEINQIASKAPLDRYLKSGLKILKIKY